VEFFVDQGDGRAGAGVGATASFVMTDYAGIKIVSYACIEGTVRAFEDVDVPHVLGWPLRAYPPSADLTALSLRDSRWSRDHLFRRKRW